VRWLAPVLSFTAEEVWKALPGTRDVTVFTSTWHALPAMEPCRVDWPAVLRVRELAARALEALRAAGSIGSALDARVDVHADGPLAATLRLLGDELRFVFISSEAAVHPLDGQPPDALQGEGFAVKVSAIDDAKCVRCWHRRPDVGSIAQHPQLCGRCAGNIDGPGESRAYA